MSYKVKKNKKKWDIEYFEYDMDGFLFHPKKKNVEDLEVTSLKLFQKDMIDYYVNSKIKDKFKSLYNAIMSSINGDETTGDAAEIVLGEIEQFRSALEIRYKRFMKNEEYKLYIENLYYLDIELRNKIAMDNYRREMQFDGLLNDIKMGLENSYPEYEENMSFGRLR